jgi:hypothetical protein
MRISSRRIGHRPRLLIGVAVTVAALALSVFAAAASALPANFWGAVPQTILTPEQLERVHRGGVESIRVLFDWGGVQPTRGGPYDWSGLDSLVGNNAKAGIDVLPFLAGSPTWAVPQSTVPGSGGAKTAARLPVSGAAKTAWAAYLTAVVGRYGPNGTFWSENPTVPKHPIRFWQIWNEPNFKYFVGKPNPTEYGTLVNQSYATLKAADPGSRVVLAGLFARPKGSRTSSGQHKSLNWYGSDFLEQMYKTVPGIKAKFSGVALHPYSYYFQELGPEIEELRHVLTVNHDGAKGLWITELGWSSEKPTSSNLFNKGEAGQAQQMKGAFNLFKKNQQKWKIQRVYWFSVDDLAGACNFCGGSGLFGEGFKPKQAWTTYAKFAGGTP